MVHDDRLEAGIVAGPVGDDLVGDVQAVQQCGGAEHLVEHRVVADVHIRALFKEFEQGQAVFRLVHAAGHRIVKADLRPQHRPQPGGGPAEGFELPHDLAEAFVEVLVQRAVGVDRVDEEVSAAVGQRGRGMQVKFLVGFGRGVVVQRHAARGHEFIGLHIRVG